MDFQQILDHTDSAPRHDIRVPATWGQGRATFGGLVAAMLYRALAADLPEARPIRSLTFSFVGPVAPAPVEITTTILRRGRAVTQMEGRMIQDGETVLAALASFGEARDSRIRVPSDPPPAIAPPAECRELPYAPGVTPEFLKHFEHRWGIGGVPFSGSRSRAMGGWVRFRQPQPTIDASQLLALVDAWPPAILPMLDQPAPASSLSWTIEFIQPLPSVAPDEWFLYEAVADQAANGYGHTAARLWTKAGELLALSRQTVTVFA